MFYPFYLVTVRNTEDNTTRVIVKRGANKFRAEDAAREEMQPGETVVSVARKTPKAKG